MVLKRVAEAQPGHSIPGEVVESRLNLIGSTSSLQSFRDLEKCRHPWRAAALFFPFLFAVLIFELRAYFFFFFFGTGA
jgi:hypothetical protein